MGVHEGHRERLRNRFFENGLDSFNELNALELLLFYAVPRKDTNVLAHTLLDHFGSLERIFSASRQELVAIEGVSDVTASLLMLIPQIARKSKVTAASKINVIRNVEDAGNYLLPRFLYQENEILLMVCLDSKKRVISCVELGRGVVNSVNVDIRMLVETALKYKAVSVIIAHNHPDSYALPSIEDDVVTQQIQAALATVHIPLEDHIIVAEDDYISYRDSNMLNYLSR